MFYIALMCQVNCEGYDVTLKLDGREFCWAAGESLVRRLEAEGVIKQMFPLHGKLFYYTYWVTRSLHSRMV